MSKTHHLKTWPEYYRAVENGTKTFEMREDDREFSVGDTLVLQEYIRPDQLDMKAMTQYTGREMEVVITYIFTGTESKGLYGPLLEKWVILSFRRKTLSAWLESSLVRLWTELSSRESERIAIAGVIVLLALAIACISFVLANIAPGATIGVLFGVGLGLILHRLKGAI